MMQALSAFLPCGGGGCGFDTDETSILSRRDNFEESPPTTPEKKLKKIDSFCSDDALKTPNMRFLAPRNDSPSTAPQRCPFCERVFSATAFRTHIEHCHKRDKALIHATRRKHNYDSGSEKSFDDTTLDDDFVLRPPRPQSRERERSRHRSISRECRHSQLEADITEPSSARSSRKLSASDSFTY